MAKCQKPGIGRIASMTDGYGFNIIDEYSRPLMSFAYKTQDDAEEASHKIKDALEKIVAVTAPNI